MTNIQSHALQAAIESAMNLSDVVENTAGPFSTEQRDAFVVSVAQGMLTMATQVAGWNQEVREDLAKLEPDEITSTINSIMERAAELRKAKPE